MPAHVNTGERAFTKVDLLDMVCQALVDWVLKVTVRHLICRRASCAFAFPTDEYPSRPLRFRRIADRSNAASPNGPLV